MTIRNVAPGEILKVQSVVQNIFTLDRVSFKNSITPHVHKNLGKTPAKTLCRERIFQFSIQKKY